MAPIIAGYWERAAFPHDLIPRIAQLNLGGATIQGYGCADFVLRLLSQTLGALRMQPVPLPCMLSSMTIFVNSPALAVGAA